MAKNFIAHEVVPHSLVGFTAALLALRPDTVAVYGFFIACVLWIVIQYIKLRDEKPGPMAAEILALKEQFAALDKAVLTNAEYSAKEFGTLKNVLQIKQLGRQ